MVSKKTSLFAVNKPAKDRRNRIANANQN